MPWKVFAIFCIISCGTISNAQGQRDTIFRWPSFTFRINASANMYWGLKKSNHEGINILRTPPAVGPELGIDFGIRISDRASVYSGVSLSMVPVHIAFNFGGENIYAPGISDWQMRDYFIGMSVYSIPLSFEYIFPIHQSKHAIITEAGIVANYNSTRSYAYEAYYSGTVENSTVFSFQMTDNNGVGWYPSGMVRIGYMKKFKKYGAFSASTRLGFTGTAIGVGSYAFNGFAYDYKGDVKLFPNFLAFDFTYHFRHSRSKK